MNTALMREQLVAYLAEADDKKIAGLYSLLEDNIKQKKSISLTEEQTAILKEERKKHLNGESKSYSWEEVKEMIRKRKAS
jgi:hypothetical protein